MGLTTPHIKQYWKQVYLKAKQINNKKSAQPPLHRFFYYLKLSNTPPEGMPLAEGINEGALRCLLNQSLALAGLKQHIFYLTFPFNAKNV